MTSRNECNHSLKARLSKEGCLAGPALFDDEGQCKRESANPWSCIRKISSSRSNFIKKSPKRL